MSDFTNGDYVEIESKVEGIAVYRPRSPLPLHGVANESAEAPINNSEQTIELPLNYLLFGILLPIILAMGIMLWQQFFQRSDRYFVTILAAILFGIGMLMVILLFARMLRGKDE